ncbi:helicase-related protein [Ammonicoccus fulvus]|uniref:Helicase-related protein n=1 Tax=Ammonicoccus fulvus TaxID=3138240 RepID=A0ABZ3FLI3_9ACTN
MTLTVAPGSIVEVRDEEWLVTSVNTTASGAQLLHVQGLSELVRGTSATFYESLDTIKALNPTDATLRADDSPGYRRAKLWLEATVRKTPLPVADQTLSVSTQALADQLPYQRSAVEKALNPDLLRPRILLADAVGLGKTLEIGMILSELVRRGRGERILIVCPRHVLEQMQHEMWTRFALPFVRLDSVGVQRVKQLLPATRNPFTYFKRVIISMDTLKQDRFVRDLRRHRWDAVVIDESHNVTNAETQNNRLARELAATTDALILASATPHNGKPESFAELVRLLEPTAVTPSGELIEPEVRRLVIRRHRHSDEVARIVGAQWAERAEPNNVLIDASAAEDAVATELDETWLYPSATAEERPSRRPQAASSGTGTSVSKPPTPVRLFPWTLAKAYLSSPAALRDTIANRLKQTTDEREIEALERLGALNDKSFNSSAKYARLLDLLNEIDVKKSNRAVVFAERVATLHWLQAKLCKDLKLKPENVEILHGGLPDDKQQEIVESFKQSNSPIRVLVTGDVASEGVNLHRQCHELIHFDIPWSLIRIEQRNGRIDRYGQTQSPRITTLLLKPTSERFSGDLRVLTRLMEKEAEAHKALGDAASLMGAYSVKAEEDAILKVLAGQRKLDDVVRTPAQVAEVDVIGNFFAGLAKLQAEPAKPLPAPAKPTYPDLDFLRDALYEVFGTPEAPVAANGVQWREDARHGTVEFVPPADLRQRLEVLPQSYLRDRKVTETLKLATTLQRGKDLLSSALTDESDSSWPEAHYLSPLHPVLEWAADRSLASLGRNEIFAVCGQVDYPTFVVLGTLTNLRGQVVAASWIAIECSGSNAYPTTYASPSELLDHHPIDQHNPGPIENLTDYQALVPLAVSAAERDLELVFGAAEHSAKERVASWQHRAADWQESAEQLAQRETIRTRRSGVRDEAELIADMAPDRRLVRPLLLIVPSR